MSAGRWIAGSAVAATLFAQQATELSRLSATADAAYKTWRERDPKLESQLVGAAKASIESRIQHLSEDAQKLTLARHELADGAFQSARKTLDAFDREFATPAVDLQITAIKSHDAQLASDAALLDKNIQVFSVDKDPAIQRVKADMEKERAALRAVRESLAEEQKTLAAIRSIGDRGEASRGPAVARVAELMSASKSDRDRLEAESALWHAYYQALPRAATVEVSKTTIAPGNPREDTARAPIVRPGAPSAPVVKPNLPVADGSRWSGAWMFPPTNRMFSGEEPELLDVTVREINGQLTGTLFARFKTVKGGTKDPLLRLDFSGPVRATRGQKMAAVTAEGIKGVVELLPGSAANLIEVTWQLDASAGPRKVRQGDVVLWKK